VTVHHTSGPLAGIKIVDLTENMAGPLATMILGDQGADVIKVESLRGDQVRRLGSGSPGLAAYFASLNRSKRSIAVDLQTERGRAILDRLVDEADVVIQAFRPAAAAKLRVDEASIRTADRQRLVYCEIIGFGRTGPLAGQAVYDHVVQALSGHAALQIDSTGTPQLIRQGMIDKATGLSAAQAITAALLRQARTGTGESIAVTMLDVALGFLWPDGMMGHTAIEPEQIGPPASNSYRLTPTADGHVAMMVVTEAQWNSLHPALGLAPPDGRGHPERLREARQKVATMTNDEVVAALSAYQVPCAPVVQLDDVADHPQVVANGSIRVVEHPVLGPIRQVAPAPTMEGVDPTQLRHAPLLGAETREVLLEHGYAASEIDALINDNIVSEPTS
jgi:crotonobetainyl-CoA:carnitine CoA-transferase CaiB-like acyl-CoA transferase